jgi:hypothetical protein
MRRRFCPTVAAGTLSSKRDTTFVLRDEASGLRYKAEPHIEG